MKELSLAFFIACASGLCWAITADLAVSNGGGFSFSPNSGSHFEPVLFDASWGHCRAFGGWNDEMQTIRRGEVPVIQKGGKVSFVANTARDPAEATCCYEIVR